MSDNRAVIVRFMRSISKASSSSGDDFHQRISFCCSFSIRFYLCDALESVPRNGVVRLTDRLDMIIVVDFDVKPQIKRTNIVQLQYVCKSHFSVPRLR